VGLCLQVLSGHRKSRFEEHGLLMTMSGSSVGVVVGVEEVLVTVGDRTSDSESEEEADTEGLIVGVNEVLEVGGHQVKVSLLSIVNKQAKLK